jgi:hypothetical protein
MSKEIISFLKGVVESDGRIDEREEMAVDRVVSIFYDVGKIKFTEIAKNGFEAFSDSVSATGNLIKGKTGEAIEKTSSLASGALGSMKKQGKKAINLCSDACDVMKKTAKEAVESSYVKKD